VKEILCSSVGKPVCRTCVFFSVFIIIVSSINVAIYREEKSRDLKLAQYSPQLIPCPIVVLPINVIRIQNDSEVGFDLKQYNFQMKEAVGIKHYKIM
jgi:hypothetical protein